MKNTIVAVAMLASFGALAAPTQLVVTPVPGARGGSVVALDLIANGESAAFQFKIATDAKSADQVDVTRCLSGLPKGRSGSCAFNNGTVIGVVYSPDNTKIPAGSIQLGQISVKGSSNLSIAQFEAYDLTGANVAADASLASQK